MKWLSILKLHLRHSALPKLVRTVLYSQKLNQLPREHFIISSYPRSGNTLIRLWLQFYMFQSQNLDEVDEQIPYIKRPSPTRKYYKSHERYDSRMTKGVFVHRLPSDSYKSLLRMSQRRKEDLGLQDLIDLDGRGKLNFYGPLKEFMTSWQQVIASPNWLVISYTTLIENPSKALTQILSHANLPIDKDLVDATIKACSVERVQKLEQNSRFRRRNPGPSLTGLGFDNHDSSSTNAAQDIDLWYSDVFETQ